MEMVENAYGFFSKYIKKDLRIDLFKSTDSADIMYKDIELGSYGIRKHKNVEWIYGTGVALPRLSIAMTK